MAKNCLKYFNYRLVDPSTPIPNVNLSSRNYIACASIINRFQTIWYSKFKVSHSEFAAEIGIAMLTDPKHYFSYMH